MSEPMTSCFRMVFSVLERVALPSASRLNAVGDLSRLSAEPDRERDRPQRRGKTPSSTA